MAKMTKKELLKRFIPKVELSKIVLETGGSNVFSGNTNPHINGVHPSWQPPKASGFSKSYHSFITKGSVGKDNIAKSAEGLERLQNKFLGQSSGAGRISEASALNLKSSIFCEVMETVSDRGNSVAASFFGGMTNEKGMSRLVDFVKIAVIQSTVESHTERMLSNKLLPFAIAMNDPSLLPASEAFDKDRVLVTDLGSRKHVTQRFSMTNPDIDASKNLLQHLQRMNSYLDSNGERIYKVPVPSSGTPSVTFDVQSSDPKHLSYFVVSYLDIKEMAAALSEYATSGLGSISEDDIKMNSYTFTDTDDGWDSELGSVLYEIVFANELVSDKVQDFRHNPIVENLQSFKVYESAGLIEKSANLNNLGYSSNFFEQNKKSNYAYAVISHYEPDNNFNQGAAVFYSLDMYKILSENSLIKSVYGLYNSDWRELVEEVARMAKIKNMTIHRRRIKPNNMTNEAGVLNREAEDFDKEDPPAMIARFSDEGVPSGIKEKNIVLKKQETVNEELQLGNLSLKNIFRRSFMFTDAGALSQNKLSKNTSTSDFGLGQYVYDLELEISDYSPILVGKKLVKAIKANDVLKKLYLEASEGFTQSDYKIATEKDPHATPIPKHINRPIRGRVGELIDNRAKRIRTTRVKKVPNFNIKNNSYSTEYLNSRPRPEVQSVAPKVIDEQTGLERDMNREEYAVWKETRDTAEPVTYNPEVSAAAEAYKELKILLVMSPVISRNDLNANIQAGRSVVEQSEKLAKLAEIKAGSTPEALKALISVLDTVIAEASKISGVNMPLAGDSTLDGQLTRNKVGMAQNNYDHTGNSKSNSKINSDKGRIKINFALPVINDHSTPYFVGYDYLAGVPDGPAGSPAVFPLRHSMGLRHVQASGLVERTNHELLKYFNDLEAPVDMSVTLSGETFPVVANDSPDSEKFTYLTPSRVRFHDKGYSTLNLFKNGTIEYINNEQKRFLVQQIMLKIMYYNLLGKLPNDNILENPNSKLNANQQLIKKQLLELATKDGTHVGKSVSSALAVLTDALKENKNTSQSDKGKGIKEADQQKESNLQGQTKDQKTFDPYESTVGDEGLNSDPSSLLFAMLGSKVLKNNLLNEIVRSSYYSFNPEKSVLSAVKDSVSDATDKAAIAKLLLRGRLKSLPNQIKTLMFDSYEQKRENIRETGMHDPLLDIVGDLEHYGAFWLNYGNIVKVEYLHELKDSSPTWLDLTTSNYGALAGTTLCRIRRYENKLLGLAKNENFELPIYNEYFLLEAGEEINQDIQPQLTLEEEKDLSKIDLDKAKKILKLDPKHDIYITPEQAQKRSYELKCNGSFHSHTLTNEYKEYAGVVLYMPCSSHEEYVSNLANIGGSESKNQKSESKDKKYQ